MQDEIQAHGVVWWLECALGTGAFWFNITIPLIGCGYQLLLKYCRCWSARTSASISQGQEAADNTTAARLERWLFLPQ